MKVKIQNRSVYHKFAEVEIEVDKDECVDTLLQDSLVDIAEAIESNRHRRSMFE